MPRVLLPTLEQHFPGLVARLHADITAERLFRILQPIADTLAPSQTVRYTRALELERVLKAEGLLQGPDIDLDRNYLNTGNTVVRCGHDERKTVWLMAHLDIISYLVEPRTEGRYPLVPLCYHMMHVGRRAGAALEFDLDSCTYVVAARGDIVTESGGGIFFEPESGAELHPGQRVCFHSTLAWDRASGELSGSLDDAGAVAALVLATHMLHGWGLKVLLALTDEEEGVAGSSNQTICRGGARLLPHLKQPDLVIVSDIHEAIPMLEGGGPCDFGPGDGASFAERASRGKGAVTPPHLYALQRRLAAELANEGISLRENFGGYVSRTEGVNAMMRTPNVAILGFVGANRHFERDVTTANMADLVNLAKSIVCLALLTQTPVWREVMGL